MAYTVCDVTAAHIPQIEVLEQQCFSTPWTAELLRSQMKDAQHEFIAALAPEGTVLGYVGMMYVLDELSTREICGFRYAAELQAILLAPQNITEGQKKLLKSYAGILVNSGGLREPACDRQLSGAE